jgi:hypothetical protein
LQAIFPFELILELLKMTSIQLLKFVCLPEVFSCDKQDCSKYVPQQIRGNPQAL